MQTYTKWEDFMKGAASELLNTELTFSNMDKGTMYYNGEYNGQKVFCSVSECYIGDYCYSAVEKVSSVTQGANVYLTLDGAPVLNV
jgi:hypothetical protein